MLPVVVPVVTVVVWPEGVEPQAAGALQTGVPSVVVLIGLPSLDSVPLVQSSSCVVVVVVGTVPP
jgi:hypothetical protein